MIDEFDPDDVPLDLETLLDDAVAAALRLGDANLFLDWMRDNIERYGRQAQEVQQDLFSERTGRGAAGEPDALLVPLSQVLGRQLWNAFPLPQNHFRPRPLARPGRNDLCFCGSGRKFKHCCARLPAFPDLDPDEVWPLVISQLNEADRRRAIASGHIPPLTLGEMAWDYLEVDNAPKKALALLEPLFGGDSFRGTDDRYDWLLNLLCNVYDRLGYVRKKDNLLLRIIAAAPRSPLRSGAWQRLAAMRMDAGNSRGAWEAFEQAQRDAPGAPALGMLEIQLLLAEQRTDEARQRARFWLGKLTRTGEVDDEFLDFFAAVAEDPHRAMIDLVAGMTEGVGDAFQELLPVLSGRPLPRYEVIALDDREPSEGEDDPFGGPGVAFGDAGPDEDGLTGALRRLDEDPAETADTEETGESQDDENPFADRERLLQAPGALRRLEREWHEVFPLEKPFSVREDAFSNADPWEPEEEASWVGWLADHPAALDSLDVLDDIATALMDHPQYGAPWFNIEVVLPVLQRGAAILEKAVAGEDQPVLPWLHPGNRPALRSLSRLLGLALGADDEDEANRLAERLLALNPDDNHGVRSLVINRYLAEGRNDDALALAAHYDKDFLPDMLYGRALALYRLGREGEAGEALGKAIEVLPKVREMLTARSPRRPKSDPHGVLVGGDEQAWLYRAAMLDHWRSTPGALEWVRHARKRR